MNCVNLGRGYRYRQDAAVPMGTDSVLLAHFASPFTDTACDLGCGGGAVMLLLALHNSAACVDGVEIRESACAIARENIENASLGDRLRVITGDIRRIEGILPGGGYDMVIANPPYMPVGIGKPPADPERRIARTEECCTLRDLCRAAAYLLKPGGKLALVHRPERMAELFYEMKYAVIEPKILRLFADGENYPPSLILVEGRRGASAGLEVMPTLYRGSAEYERMAGLLE